MAFAAGMTRLDLYVRFDRPLDPGEVERLRAATRRRAAFAPIAYVTGEREFFSLPFLVSEAVLVPRPETELVVEEALRLLRRANSGPLVGADLGTGSGCIAISLLTRVPGLRMVGVDVSRSALDVAERNAARHGVADRFRAKEGDLLSAVETLLPEHGLDVVVSNPPYVSAADFGSLPRDVREHEPRLALVAGEDGLLHLGAIARGAPRLLKPGGSIVIEFGRGQASAVESLLRAANAFEDVRIVADHAGIPRIASARRASSPPRGE